MDKPNSKNAANTKSLILERIAKNGGLRALVNAHCCECIYDELEPGTWRNQVKNCPVVNCSLYPVRPQPRSASKTDLNKY